MVKKNEFTVAIRNRYLTNSGYSDVLQYVASGVYARGTVAVMCVFVIICKSGVSNL